MSGSNPREIFACFQTAPGQYVVVEVDQDGYLDVVGTGDIGNGFEFVALWGTEDGFEEPTVILAEGNTISFVDLDGTDGLEALVSVDNRREIHVLNERKLVRTGVAPEGHMPIDVDGDGVVDWVQDAIVLRGACR